MILVVANYLIALAYILLYSLSIYGKPDEIDTKVTWKIGPERTISQTAATKICDKNLAFARGPSSSTVNRLLGVLLIVKGLR